MWRKFLLTFLALFALGIGLIAVALQTERVQQLIDQEFKKIVHERTGWTISYAHFGWEFPFRFTLTQINLEDSKGTRIELDRVSGTINPVTLLKRYILIHDLDIVYEEWNIVGTVRGTPEKNNYAASLTVTSLVEPELLISVKTKLKDFSGPLDLSGKWHELDGAIKGNVTWNGQELTYRDLSGKVEDYTVSGAFIVDRKLQVDGTELLLKHPQGDGALQLSGTWHELKAHFDLTVPTYEILSEIHLKGDLTRHKEKIDSQFHASFNFNDERYYTDTNLSWSPNSPLKFRTNGRDKDGMTFDADFFIGQDKSQHLNVVVEKGRMFNQIQLEALLPFEKDRWEYYLDLDGLGYKANLKGNASIEPEKQSVEVTKMKAKWDEFELNLEDSFSVEHSNDHLEVTPFFGRLENGTVYVSFDYIGNNIHIAARLVDLPLKLFPLVDEGLPAETTFNANLFLFGPTDHLGGQAQVEIPEIKLTSGGSTQIPTLEGKLTANLFDDKLEVSGNFAGISSTPIAVEASIPMILSLDPLQLDIHLDQPFSTQLSYNGPIGPITELLTSETALLKGDLDLELELTGTINHPQVAGSGHFKNGSYENMDSGVAYQGIAADFNAEGDHVVVSNITANDGEGGTISGKGTINASVEKQFPFDFSLDLQNIWLVKIDWLRASGTGQAQFSGDLTKAKVTAQVETDGLSVSIPEGRSSNVKVIPITYINQSPDEPPPTKVTKVPFEWPVDLDIAIETKRAVVNGDDFNTSWNGKASIQGTLQSPQLGGKIRITEGTYRFNGHPFEITQGSITFNGHPVSDTNLYVVAEQDIGEITAEVVVKGALDNLELALRSKPALSQREVLSWILFGRGASEISPLENQELTKSISELNRGGGKKDLLTRFRQQIGIDRIDFIRDITGETNEMSVEVGKYISKGVLVSVNRNITNDANRIGIEARLTRNFKVEAKVGDNAEGHLFLKWKRDY